MGFQPTGAGGRDLSLYRVTVLSPYSQVVRDFPAAMVNAYYDGERERRAEYREKGIAIYLSELEQLRGQLDEEMDKRFNFERESDLTNLFIEYSFKQFAAVTIGNCMIDKYLVIYVLLFIHQIYSIQISLGIFTTQVNVQFITDLSTI